MTQLTKIIWAADPLDDKKNQSHGIAVLKELSKRTGASIEPVYVLSDGLLSLSIPREELVRQFKPASERALKHLIKSGQITNLKSPTVLVSAPSSRTGAAQALDRYAGKQKADLIMVNSHGRHGLKRAILGSFAETLALHSKTPVLISGPKSKRNLRLDHILFPTDFSAGSKKMFKRVLELAKKLNAKITLLHAVINPIEPFVQSGAVLMSGGFVSAHDYVTPSIERQKKTASLWAKEAKSAGVKLTSVIDVDSGSVSLSILDFAQKNETGLIAMASQSSAASAVLLGSVGRNVARQSPCPVWFLRV